MLAWIVVTFCNGTKYMICQSEDTEKFIIFRGYTKNTDTYRVPGSYENFKDAYNAMSYIIGQNVLVGNLVESCV